MSIRKQLPTALSTFNVTRGRRARVEENQDSVFVDRDWLTWLSVERKIEKEWIDIQNQSLKGMMTRKQRVGHGEKQSEVGGVHPYEEHRVRLQELAIASETDTTFINASYVTSDRDYIAAAMPQNFATERDFWRMIYETKASTVVMLNKPGEREKDQYWPTKEQKIRTYGDVIKVILRSERYDHNIYSWVRQIQVIVNPKYYQPTLEDWNFTDEELLNSPWGSLSTPDIRGSTESSVDLSTHQNGSTADALRLPLESVISVSHLQYDDWEDMGIPDDKEVFFQFANTVSKQHQDRKKIGPMVVHCFGGVGRTGTFLTIHITFEAMIRLGGKAIDVAELLALMRDHRAAMVQTTEQYKFCYRIILQFYEGRRFFRAGVLSDIENASETFHAKSDQKTNDEKSSNVVSVASSAN